MNFFLHVWCAVCENLVSLEIRKRNWIFWKWNYQRGVNCLLDVGNATRVHSLPEDQVSCIINLKFCFSFLSTSMQGTSTFINFLLQIYNIQYKDIYNIQTYIIYRHIQYTDIGGLNNVPKNKKLQDDRSQIWASPPLSLVPPVAQILICALKPTGHTQRPISFQPQSCQLEVMAKQAPSSVCCHVYNNCLPERIIKQISNLQ